MDMKEIYACLSDIFAVVFPDQKIVLSPATTAADVVGWDSLKQVEIIVMAQQRFGVRFTTKEIDNLESVGDLARTIGARTSDC